MNEITISKKHLFTWLLVILLLVALTVLVVVRVLQPEDRR